MAKEFNKVKLDVTFTQASSRSNLTSGENISVSLGKISKWFADLGTAAFTPSSNYVPFATVTGTADANTYVTNNGWYNWNTTTGTNMPTTNYGILLSKAYPSVQVFIPDTGTGIYFRKKTNADTAATAWWGLTGTAGNTYNLANFLTAVTTSGSGNAVTAITASNGALTVTKGSTFSLSTHTHNYAGSSSAGGVATSATRLANITVDSTTVHNTSGTFAFSGNGAPWDGTDWVGLQVGDNLDKFQIRASGNRLWFRQNDSGGTNTSWSDWVECSVTGHGHSQYYDSTISRTANTVLAAPNGSNGSATFRKLVAADIPSLSYLPLSGGTVTGAVNFANNVMNKMGDDFQFGDGNVSGHMVVQGLNNTTGINLKYASTTYPSCNMTVTTATNANKQFLGLYNADANGIGIVLGGATGGLLVLGGGESPNNFHAIMTDASTNPLGAAWTDATENTVITADTNIYLMAGANGLSSSAHADWTNCKTAIFNSSGVFYPSINNKGSIGGSSYYWSTSYISTMYTGGLIIKGGTTASNAYDSTNPKITFWNAGADQNGQLIWTDYDSVQAPASLTLAGNQGNEYFIAPNIKASGNFFGQVKRSDGGTWISARTNAAVYANSGASTTGSYYPATFVKTQSGGWAMGALGNTNKLCFAYTTDANFSANNNTATYTIYLPEASGTVSLDGHTHSYLPLSGGTLSGNATISKASGDTGFYATRSDTSVTVWMGVGSGGTNHGIYSNKLGKWMIYGDASNVYLNGNAATATTATSATNATNATNAYSTLTNPTSATTYYVDFHSGASNGNKALRHNSGLWYYTLGGTTAAVGEGTLALGNAIASGTADNKRGFIRLYGTGTGYQAIATANTSASSYTATIPAATGNIPLYTVLYTSTASPSSVNPKVNLNSSKTIIGVYDMLKVWLYIGNTNVVREYDILTTTAALSQAFVWVQTEQYQRIELNSNGYTLSVALSTGTGQNVSFAKVIGIRFQ